MKPRSVMAAPVLRAGLRSPWAASASEANRSCKSVCVMPIARGGDVSGPGRPQQGRIIELDTRRGAYPL